MGIDDRVNNTVINHLGAAKEGAGKMTGNEELEREGRHDQAQAKLQEAGEKVKDAARKLKEGFSKE